MLIFCVQLGVVHKFNLFHVRFTNYGVHIEQVFLDVQLNWNLFAGLRNKMFSSPQIYKRIETLQGTMQSLHRECWHSVQTHNVTSE